MYILDLVFYIFFSYMDYKPRSDFLYLPPFMYLQFLILTFGALSTMFVVKTYKEKFHLINIYIYIYI